MENKRKILGMVTLILLFGLSTAEAGRGHHRHHHHHGHHHHGHQHHGHHHDGYTVIYNQPRGYYNRPYYSQPRYRYYATPAPVYSQPAYAYPPNVMMDIDTGFGYFSFGY